jgi:hypothetical protein
MTTLRDEHTEWDGGNDAIPVRTPARLQPRQLGRPNEPREVATAGPAGGGARLRSQDAVARRA